MRINVFIFRRDLRIEDNLGFMKMAQRSMDEGIKLLPIFIFNPLQIDPKKNKYYNPRSVWFMIECLKTLPGVWFFEGDDIDILNGLLKKKYVIDAIGFNTDYTPFSRRRDAKIMAWCEKKGIEVMTARDYTLIDYEKVATKGGKPYEMFTPFYRSFMKLEQDIPKPNLNLKKSAILFEGKVEGKALLNKYVVEPCSGIEVGRKAALEILTQIRRGVFKNYLRDRNLPGLERGTTRLSVYMKFGCVSVREVYWAVRGDGAGNMDLARELVWREFYAHVAYNFPRVLEGRAFKERMNLVKWVWNAGWWRAWCEGRTGVPLVDAAMRELNTNGWMHNRCRMVVATFLTKDLLIDWRKGEEYFATRLLDYDPASNSGGWQWSASVGTDALPVYRTFNPYLQAEKYDPQASYIKRWVPELRSVPAKDIHAWEERWKSWPGVYIEPIVVHKVQVGEAMKILKNV